MRQSVNVPTKEGRIYSHHHTVPRQQQPEQARGRPPPQPLANNDSITSDSDPEPQNQRPRRRGARRQGGGLPGLDEVEDTGRAVTNTANQVGRTAQQVAGGQDDDNKPLKLRLDLVRLFVPWADIPL